MKKKSKSATKKSPVSKAKTSSKKAATKKAAPKKVVTKKAVTKKAAAKKTAAKKTATKKVVAKKTSAKKTTAKAPATKKAVATKKAPRSKPAAAKVAKPKRTRAVAHDENNIVPAESAANPSVKLNIGDRAPEVVLPGVGRDATTSTIDLGHYAGRQPVILYFYPKDDTPGCTKEACDLRDNWSRLTGLNVAVFGVSPDDVESHVRFAQKFELPYTLLADTSNQASNAYGVWVEKNMYGRKYFGIQRATFLIDREGKIAAIWPKVSVEGHVDEIIETIERLQL